MTKEIELKDLPHHGLVSHEKTRARRDISMDFWVKKGMEVQPWVVEKNGIIYYGFSYNYRYVLSEKQLEEFERLRK